MCGNNDSDSDSETPWMTVECVLRPTPDKKGYEVMPEEEARALYPEKVFTSDISEKLRSRKEQITAYQPKRLDEHMEEVD